MEVFQTYAEKKNIAIDTLVKLGFAKYLKDIDLYHGRAGDGTNWEIKPQLNNSENNTGNYNVYSISGIYTSDYKTAQEFANERTRYNYKNYIPEVHKIVGIDEDAIILDVNFKINQLKETEKKQFFDAMKVLTEYSITKANPIKFEYKQAYPKIVEVLKYKQKSIGQKSLSNYQTLEVIEELIQDKEVMTIFKNDSENLKQFIIDMVSANNTRQLLYINPMSMISSYSLGKDRVKIRNNVYKINSNYMSAWCANNHIVGYKDEVYSATLQGKQIDCCHLFDTKKIMSEKQYGEKMHEILNTYSHLSSKLGGLVSGEIKDFLTTANSEEIMKFICQDKTCKELFDKDSGIWEGWTVGEHTRGVLNFFDKYFQNIISDELKPFMRIVMLAHDIGKGVAQEKNIHQKESNQQMAEKLYNALNISSEYRKLINFVIGQSQDYTSLILRNGKNTIPLNNALLIACNKAYKDAFGNEPTKDEIEGLKNLCVILQECDSGSYTRYAGVQENNGRYIGGGNDRFTNSFTLDKNGNPRLKAFEDEMQIQ